MTNSDAPIMRSPPPKSVGVDLNWYTRIVEYPFPVWVASALYLEKIDSTNDAILIPRVEGLLKNLHSELLKRGEELPHEIEFKYWRKVNDRATKMKPLALKASVFEHPDYHTGWIFIEYA